MLFFYKSTKRLFYAVCICCTVFALLFYAPVPRFTEILGFRVTIYYAGFICSRLVDGGLGTALWQFFLAMLIPGMICSTPLTVTAAWKYFRTANRFRTYCDATGFVQSIDDSIRCVNAVPTVLLSRKQKDRLIRSAKHIMGLYGFALIESGRVREGLEALRECVNAPKLNPNLRSLVACGLLRYYIILNDTEMTERCKNAVMAISEKLPKEKRDSRRELARYVEKLSNEPTEDTLQFFTDRLCKCLTNAERAHLLCTLAVLYYHMGDGETAADHLLQAEAIAPQFYTVHKTSEHLGYAL